MARIDLNCDMGESFGAYTMGNDIAILDFVNSANIACGFHAGDPPTIHKTVEAALRKGVAVGAHPGFPDLQGFGRRTMAVSASEAYDMVIYQIGAVAAFAQALGGRLTHVKAHGALYNTAAKDQRLANAIAKAVHDFDPRLIMYGLAGSAMIEAAEDVGLRAANEVFADRTYQDDGSLTPRSQSNAMIEDEEGQHVARDEPIVFVEIMKMEIPVVAPAEGKIIKLLVAKGDAVTEGQRIAILETP